MVADCEAVCRAGLWSSHQQVSDKFIFASCWEEFAGGPISTIHKVSAHLTRQTAIDEGWEVDWVGNDVADALAKDARPEVEGHGTLRVIELRQAAKALEAVVAAVPAGFYAGRSA